MNLEDFQMLDNTQLIMKSLRKTFLKITTNKDHK